jgi:uncharacterized protein YfdQ (DUF2303 family)
MDMNATKPEAENLAQTLSRVLPQAQLVHSLPLAEIRATDALHHIAVPKGHELKQLDNELLLDHPRRTKAQAALSTPESFIAYVLRHAQARSVVWCQFNPQTYSLSFQAVIDEHDADTAGWRAHTADYTPDMSAEWKVWTTNNGADRIKEQLQFAEFLERHDQDIATQDGYPNHQQMLKMATDFEANSEKTFKSVARLQGGGMRLQYVNDDDARTLEEMKIFEKFQIGIPVFWAGTAYRIDARLKYRHGSGKVKFYYELIRADRVHEAAAKELIEVIRAGIGATPLLMGSCNKPSGS